MSILSRLTVTPLLYACGALLLACIALGVTVHVKNADLVAAEAKQGQAEADRNAVATERDAFKGRVSELLTANKAFGRSVGALKTALAACQGESARLDAAGERAVAAAQADARDADRTLKAFTAQFQTESRKPACARALEALDQACPALEGY